jgi:hypothetical protein
MAVPQPSGTYAYNPPIGDLVVAAYRRVGIHRSEIVTEHLADARTECNLMQVQWANLGPLIYTVDVQTDSLIAGHNVYSILANTVMVTDVYISIPNGDGTTSDRIITPLSRTEYASMPNKLGQGSPTSFWYDRQSASQTVTMWPNPDGTEPTFSYYRFTQMQDAILTNVATPQIMYLCLDAYVAGLAHRLSVIYPPKARPDGRPVDYEGLATKALNTMFSQLVENVGLYIQPQSFSYWR